MSHPERIDPVATEPGILALHLKRYDFALPYCGNATVLDVACGLGYGTAHLARVAAYVRGIDVSPEAIAVAAERYRRPNIEFQLGDAQALREQDRSYDVVCSFETIEHVADPEMMLREVVRVLRDGGTFLVSTPKADESTHAPSNPFHRSEWSAADFEALLSRFFVGVELFGQRRIQTTAHRLAQRLDVLGLRKRLSFLRSVARILGTTPTAELGLDDIVIERGVDGPATEVVAVCTRPRR